VANQATLAVLILGAVALGWLNPHAVRAVAGLTGLAVPVAHAVYLATGLRLPYATHPAGWAGPATLLVLVVPAAVAAAVGAAARRLSA
jgi:hypothetical protein